MIRMAGDDDRRLGDESEWWLEKQKYELNISEKSSNQKKKKKKVFGVCACASRPSMCSLDRDIDHHLTGYTVYGINQPSYPMLSSKAMI